MTQARNAPCPCGSGRKYKHCCLAAAAREAESPVELASRRHARAYQGFPPRMLRFVEETYGPHALEEAWSEFLLFPEEPVEFDVETPQLPLFMPWFFHVWRPDPHGTLVADPALHDRAPTAVLLERQGARLDPALRRYLEHCVESAPSFHEVTAVTPGRGFQARDILTGEESDVREQGASRTVRPGDLLFAHIVHVDGVALLEALSPLSLPPDAKLAVIELRKKIHRTEPEIDPASLREWDIELRELYFDALERLLEPGLPPLHNTDGDPLQLQRLLFDLDPAPDAVAFAFEALRHLATPEEAEAALADAERDASGTPIALRFSWSRRNKRRSSVLQHTVLGDIEIRPGRLSCALNSNRRAAAFRRYVKKALPERARYRLSELDSIEYALANAPTRDAGPRTPAPPEVQAHVSRYLAEYYERWLEEKIPALGGRTPLAAVRDPDGREQVEVLVRSIERDGPRMDPPLDPAITRRLRERLGLTAAGTDSTTGD
jgi:hypothetical protein